MKKTPAKRTRATPQEQAGRPIAEPVAADSATAQTATPASTATENAGRTGLPSAAPNTAAPDGPTPDLAAPGTEAPTGTPAKKAAAKRASTRKAPTAAAPKKSGPEAIRGDEAAHGTAQPASATPDRSETAAPDDTSRAAPASAATRAETPTPDGAALVDGEPERASSTGGSAEAPLTGELLPARGNALEPATGKPSMRDIARRPRQAAELLALAAVARYGPAAATNIASLRGSYPDASADGVARMAVHRFVRQARNRGAVAGLAGPLVVLLDAGTLPTVHAELVLNIAAAYGLDPTAPERAAELLFLQGVYESAAEASTAVSAALEPASNNSDGDPTRLGRPLARSLTLGVLRVGARRMMSLIPGAGAVIGAVANTRATDELATRALRFYRRTS